MKDDDGPQTKCQGQQSGKVGQAITPSYGQTNSLDWPGGSCFSCMTAKGGTAIHRLEISSVLDRNFWPRRWIAGVVGGNAGAPQAGCSLWTPRHRAPDVTGANEGQYLGRRLTWGGHRPVPLTSNDRLCVIATLAWGLGGFSGTSHDAPARLSRQLASVCFMRCRRAEMTIRAHRGDASREVVMLDR